MATVRIVWNAGPVSDVHRLPVDDAPMKLGAAQKHYGLMARSGYDLSASRSLPSLSPYGETAQRSLALSDLGVNDHVFRSKVVKFSKKIWQMTELEIPFAQNEVKLFWLQLPKRLRKFLAIAIASVLRTPS